MADGMDDGLDKLLGGLKVEFNNPGEAFQEATDIFVSVISYLRQTTFMEGYQLRISPDFNKKGVIDGYFIDGMIKTDVDNSDSDDDEMDDEYPVSKYVSIVKLYLAYMGDKLQKPGEKSKPKEHSSKKGNGKKTLEEKVWVLSKL
jgi:hypothetical protein